MKVKSSIELEGKGMEQLKNIQKVSAPAHLYENILQKIEENKTSVIPMHWVKVAAAIVVLFISADVLLIVRENSTSEQSALTELVPNQTLSFYE